MKKILSLILCFALVFCLAACGGSEQPSDNSSATSNGAQSGTNEETGGNTNTETNGAGSSDGQLYARVLAALGNPAVTDAAGSASDAKGHMFTISENGVVVRYIGIDALKAGEEVNILQITDLHFNKMNDRDNAEQNPSVMDTRKYRHGFRDESTVPNAKKLIGMGKNFDAVAITGDIIDYLTWGSLDLVKEHIWDVLGDKAIVPLGGHDATRVMESYVADPTTLESRLDILQSGWQHDVHYSNKIVKDRVMLVQLNNGQSKYYGTQAEKLEADIKYARENNLVILIFQHEPLATKNMDYARVYPLDGSNDPVNYYKSCIGGSKYTADATTQKVYDLITQNADVVRGVFAGHMHQNYYYELDASYVKNGETVKTTIPHVVLHCAPSSKGYVNVINIK